MAFSEVGCRFGCMQYRSFRAQVCTVCSDDAALMQS
jgi:hypothetical protein